MSIKNIKSVILDKVTFYYPQGEILLDEVSLQLNSSLIGIIGNKGSGKTTLLRLLKQEIKPVKGKILFPYTDKIFYLPQIIELNQYQTIGDLLQIRPELNALAAIEKGAATEVNYQILENNWDILERSNILLHRLGFTNFTVDTSTSKLSGGQLKLIALAALKLKKYSLIILDEPTNSLDSTGKEIFYNLIKQLNSLTIISSHDETTLNLMHQTIEIRSGKVETFGGNYVEYEYYKKNKYQTMLKELKNAEKQLNTIKKQRALTETKLARSKRKGEEKYQSKQIIKAVKDKKKSKAENTAGKIRTKINQNLEKTKTLIQVKEKQLGTNSEQKIIFTNNDDKSRRKLSEFTLKQQRHSIYLGDHIVLVGPNGSGKTTLLQKIYSDYKDTVNIGYIPQVLNELNPKLDPLENIQLQLSEISPQEIRAFLAKLNLTQKQLIQPTGSLSGGELFRIYLAIALLKQPDMLILDEPTNNLDLKTIKELTTLLQKYQGSLIIVSHDNNFLRKIDINRTIIM